MAAGVAKAHPVYRFENANPKTLFQPRMLRVAADEGKQMEPHVLGTSSIFWESKPLNPSMVEIRPIGELSGALSARTREARWPERVTSDGAQVKRILEHWSDTEMAVAHLANLYAQVRGLGLSPAEDEADLARARQAIDDFKCTGKVQEYSRPDLKLNRENLEVFSILLGFSEDEIIFTHFALLKNMVGIMGAGGLVWDTSYDDPRARLLLEQDGNIYFDVTFQRRHYDESKIVKTVEEFLASKETDSAFDYREPKSYQFPIDAITTIFGAKVEGVWPFIEEDFMKELLRISGKKEIIGEKDFIQTLRQHRITEVPLNIAGISTKDTTYLSRKVFDYLFTINKVTYTEDEDKLVQVIGFAHTHPDIGERAKYLSPGDMLQALTFFVQSHHMKIKGVHMGQVMLSGVQVTKDNGDSLGMNWYDFNDDDFNRMGDARRRMLMEKGRLAMDALNQGLDNEAVEDFFKEAEKVRLETIALMEANKSFIV